MIEVEIDDRPAKEIKTTELLTDFGVHNAKLVVKRAAAEQTRVRAETRPQNSRTMAQNFD